MVPALSAMLHIITRYFKFSGFRDHTQGSPVGNPAAMTLPCPLISLRHGEKLRLCTGYSEPRRAACKQRACVGDLAWLAYSCDAQRAGQSGGGWLATSLHSLFSSIPLGPRKGSVLNRYRYVLSRNRTGLLCRAECWRTTGRPPYATSSTAWRACARGRPAWWWTLAGAWCVCSARTPARTAEPRSQAPAEIRCEPACTAPAWTLPRSGGSCAHALRSAVMKSGAVHPGLGRLCAARYD